MSIHPIHPTSSGVQISFVRRPPDPPNDTTRDNNVHPDAENSERANKNIDANAHSSSTVIDSLANSRNHDLGIRHHVTAEEARSLTYAPSSSTRTTHGSTTTSSSAVTIKSTGHPSLLPSYPHTPLYVDPSIPRQVMGVPSVYPDQRLIINSVSAISNARNDKSAVGLGGFGSTSTSRSGSSTVTGIKKRRIGMAGTTMTTVSVGDIEGDVTRVEHIGGNAGNVNGSTSQGGSKRKGRGRERSRDEGDDDRPPTKKVKIGARASIACITCRKRKVRCSGDFPICAFCATKSLPCTYEGHPAQLAQSNSEHNPPRSSSKHPPSTTGYLNPLSALHHPSFSVPLPPTPTLLEAINQFKTNFHDTGLFTFFNFKTILADIQAGEIPRDVSFAVLALSARFVPALALHSASGSTNSMSNGQASANEGNQNNSNSATPIQQAGIHFASLASSIIDQTPHVVSIYRCQANLLLGLFDYLEGEEVRGFMRLGAGIRMTQVLRLPFEDDCPNEGAVPTHPLGSGGGNGIGKAFLKSEMRRRTFWSAFLLDRLLSARDRPVTIRESNTRFVRMPCTDEEYENGRLEVGRGQPPRLKKVEEWGSLCFIEERVKERMSDLYGFLLRITDFWSDVASFTGQGGHSMDRRGPWKEGTAFDVLNERLKGWFQQLPEEMRWTEGNFERWNEKGQGRLFAVLHLVYFSSVLSLHRDFLPFAPPKGYDARNGPVDVELVDKDEPLGWWEESLKEVVHSSIEITNLFGILEDRGVTLHHIFAGFAVLTAGSMHAYMLFTPLPGDIEEASEYLSKDAKILEDMRRIFNIAKGWCNSLVAYFELLATLSGALNTSTTSGKKRDIQPVFKLRQGIVKLLRNNTDEDDLAEDKEVGQKKPGEAEKVKPDLKALLAATSGARKQLEIQEREMGLRRSNSVSTDLNTPSPSLQIPTASPLDTLISPPRTLTVQSTSYITPQIANDTPLFNAQYWQTTQTTDSNFEDPLLTSLGLGQIPDINPNVTWHSTFGIVGGYGTTGAFDFNNIFANSVMGYTGLDDLMGLGLAEENQ